ERSRDGPRRALGRKPFPQQSLPDRSGRGESFARPYFTRYSLEPTNIELKPAQHLRIGVGRRNSSATRVVLDGALGQNRKCAGVGGRKSFGITGGRYGLRSRGKIPRGRSGNPYQETRCTRR